MNIPTATPDKLYMIVRTATPEQLEALHLVTYHILRHQAPAERYADLKPFMELFEEADETQRRLIYQVAYHIIKRNRS